MRFGGKRAEVRGELGKRKESLFCSMHEREE